MPRFETVATGGTFDLLHRGHLELLREAFSISSLVIIGLTGDDFAARRGKIPFNNYLRRFENLAALIKEHFPGSEFAIVRLDDDFGPAVLGGGVAGSPGAAASSVATAGRTVGGVQALVASEETAHRGDHLNRLRARKDLPPVQVVAVPMVMAHDGRRLSSTRLRNSEVDFDGKPKLTASSPNFEQAG